MGAMLKCLLRSIFGVVTFTLMETMLKCLLSLIFGVVTFTLMGAMLKCLLRSIFSGFTFTLMQCKTGSSNVKFVETKLTKEKNDD